MALSVVLHAFVVLAGIWCLWVGYQIWFRGNHFFVRDHRHVQLPRSDAVAKPYAITAFASGAGILLLCLATLLGLPFAVWLGGVMVVVLSSLLVRHRLISLSQARARNEL